MEKWSCLCNPCCANCSDRSRPSIVVEVLESLVMEWCGKEDRLWRCCGGCCWALWWRQPTSPQHNNRTSTTMSGDRLWWVFFALVVETASPPLPLLLSPSLFVIWIMDVHHWFALSESAISVLKKLIFALKTWWSGARWTDGEDRGLKRLDLYSYGEGNLTRVENQEFNVLNSWVFCFPLESSCDAIVL